jgi:hypothetical protein
MNPEPRPPASAASDSDLQVGETQRMPGTGSGDNAGPDGRSLALPPGTVLARRYRIVAPLGRGGMGEVYRAEDLRLGESVAVKLLAPELAGDRSALERMLGEVRVGRRVSHPNVCRIHDLVESDDLAFVTMEYVDGEDLSSLLRRVGRLPPDKVSELLRDLCAGLAAIHDQGLVHRDLKPANVLIDSRGRPRISDFGVAAMRRELAGAGIAGTLAYMAPEQIAGAEASPASDLYSLGLVAYEMLTGRRAFPADTVGELLRMQLERPPEVTPETAPGTPPELSQAVLACLASNPTARPRDARQVLAGLPVESAVAAAIAAGETPSPEMVAAAGPVGELAPWKAALFFAAIVALLFGVTLLEDHVRLYRQVGPIRPPEVLRHRADEVLALVGARAGERDRASWFGWQEIGSMRRWKRDTPASSLRPGPLRFVDRRSPVELLPKNALLDNLSLPGYSRVGVVSRDDPPFERPGEAEVVLDPAGNLVELRHVPAGEPAPGEVAWQPLLAATGLDPASLQSATPRGVAAVGGDRRFAWTGSFAGAEDPVRVEAAALGATPVWLRVIGPWVEAAPSTGRTRTARAPVATAVVVLAFLTVLVVGPWMVLKSLHRGRADRRGAQRLGLAAFAALLAGGVVQMQHQTDPGSETLLFGTLLCQAMALGLLAWLLYVAVEPTLRRRLPLTLVGWNRLLAGGWRDPLVGRDVLVGLSAGLLAYALIPLTVVIARSLGETGRFGAGTGVVALSGLGSGLSYVLYLPIAAVVNAIGFLFLLVVLRGVVRNPHVALVALWLAIATQLTALAPSGTWHDAVRGALGAAIYTWVLVRHGLLAVATALLAGLLFLYLPLTLDTSAAHFGRSALVLGGLAALAAWGFRAAVGRQALLKGDLLGD